MERKGFIFYRTIKTRTTREDIGRVVERSRAFRDIRQTEAIRLAMRACDWRTMVPLSAASRGLAKSGLMLTRIIDVFDFRRLIEVLQYLTKS
jgi:hypothetical protein